MSVLCPHCKNSVDAAPSASGSVLCDSCGASFPLDRDTTADWHPSEHRRTLGKFELHDMVGAGAFGSVYRAKDKELGRTVAIKIPRPGNFGSSVEADRFLREARSVAQLRHPSIVSVFEIGQDNGMPYLVSEFVHGITLADLLTSERLPPRAAAELVAEIADSLHYAHEQGVIHRDVKPSNIMIETRGKEGSATILAAKRYFPRLMDFGLAKRDTGEITMTTEGQVLGTPAYMSPEQARGDSHSVDRRGDVYSVGVILYQLLTGELPFKGNPRMLLHQVLNDEPNPPRQRDPMVPKDLETICLKGMAKDPARRYATAEEMAGDLRRFLRGEAIRARRVSPVERSWRWCRRNPAVAGLSTAVVVLIASLAGIAVSRTWNERSVPRLPANPATPPHAPSANEKDDLLDVIADLDRTDPDWRFDRIEAKRKFIPDEQNSAIAIRNTRRLLDAQFLKGSKKDVYRELIHRGFIGNLGALYPELTAKEIEEIYQSHIDASRLAQSIYEFTKQLGPSDPLKPEAANSIKTALETAGPALIEARRIANLPDGRHAINYTHDSFNTLLPHISEVRLVAMLLSGDAVLQAESGHMAEAMTACCAMLNAARSVGDEPFAASQVARYGRVGLGVDLLERVLAAGQSTGDDLAKLQEILRLETQHAPISITVRGERAGYHWFFSSIEAGDVKPEEAAKLADLPPPPKDATGASVRAVHAWFLRHYTRVANFANRPMHEQLKQAAQFDTDLKDAPKSVQRWSPWIKKLVLYYSGFVRRMMICRARTQCALTAVAAERYRLAHGDWPRELAALVPTYLKDDPIDPCDGRPLLFKRIADGLLIYSVGPDGVDNLGNLNRTFDLPEGTDIGFQLWDVAKRQH